MPHVQIFSNGRPVNMARMMKPPPIVKNIQITLKQAYMGVTLPVQIERWIIFNNEKRIEKEKIYVPIKKGVDNGEILIIKSKGNSRSDTLKGDVKIFINVKNDSEFKREGLNLILSKKISLKESLTGFKFDIKHINGKIYTINNEKGNVIFPFYKKEIIGLGMSRMDIIGNLIIKFSIEFPKRLSIEQVDQLKNIL